MTIPDEVLSSIGPVIESVARDSSKRYKNWGGTHEDMVSECYVWLFDHPEKTMRWLDSDVEPYGVKKLSRALRNHCIDAGEDMRAAAGGYSRDDLVYYSKAMVRELLPKVYDIQAWIYPEQGDEGRKPQGDPAAGGNWVATLADVAQALTKLDARDQDILKSLHGTDQWTNNELAEFYGISKQTMSDWHERAIKRLVDQLGGPRPRAAHDADCEHIWRGRSSISNAAARAYQQSVYEED